MTVRRELPDDLDAVRAVHLAAFGREVEARLADELRADADVTAALVAEVEGAVVGSVLLSRASIGGRPSTALGPVGVLPEHQRRGLGSALVQAALDTADAAGAPEVVLLGDPGWYSRFGFVAGSSMGVQPPEPVWGRYFQVRPLSAWDPRAVGPFRYAPAFERL